ncbi:MAG: cupin domain-containing protein [Actinomycetota bacterium]|nr:cupin domain-containing protein [Actinomycetota bacterium]
MGNEPIRADRARTTTTPNATMTTLASPTQGGAEVLSLWTVEMAEGATGPLHAFDSEQLWTVRSGRLAVELGGTTHELADGDTLVLPAGEARRVRALTAVEAVVCGRGDAVVQVVGEDAPRGTPDWIA